MPGKIATYLLGAQGGAEDDFARLYEATNPVLLRYLRVTVDADPAELADLALGAWAIALRQLKVCPADDDAWLELVVGSAREAAAGRLGRDPGSSSTATSLADSDDVDHAIEVLRACPPDQADVLAMGVIANLGREATSRLTGREPAAVLALVQQGHERLLMSFEELIAALRVPGRPDEVADLQLVTPLIAAALTQHVPTAPTTATGTQVEPSLAAMAEPSLVELLGIESSASASVFQLTAVGSAAGSVSRPARAGVGAAVWVVALGGVGTAAAMSGLITAAVDGILGDHGERPLVTAEGPVRPGAPSTDGGATDGGASGGRATGGKPQAEPKSATGTDGPTRTVTLTPVEPPRIDAGGSTTPVSLPGRSTSVEIVLASYVVPDRSTPSTPIDTPIESPATPTAPPVQETLVPRPGNGFTPFVTAGNGDADGTAKAVAKATKAADKAAAKAKAKATKAAAKAKAKATKAAKAKAKAATKATKAKALKAKATKAAKAKASAKAKAKAAKSLGYHPCTAKGKAVGHQSKAKSTRA